MRAVCRGMDVLILGCCGAPTSCDAREIFDSPLVSVSQPEVPPPDVTPATNGSSCITPLGTAHAWRVLSLKSAEASGPQRVEARPVHRLLPSYITTYYE